MDVSACSWITKKWVHSTFDWLSKENVYRTDSNLDELLSNNFSVRNLQFLESKWDFIDKRWFHHKILEELKIVNNKNGVNGTIIQREELKWAHFNKNPSN